MKTPDGKLVRECIGIDGSHQYVERECPKCGAVFCYSCCMLENVSEGGKYDMDKMLCPCCGHDIYILDFTKILGDDWNTQEYSMVKTDQKYYMSRLQLHPLLRDQ
jgi:MinD superfamily P-loop ATPase